MVCFITKLSLALLLGHSIYFFLPDSQGLPYFTFRFSLKRCVSQFLIGVYHSPNTMCVIMWGETPEMKNEHEMVGVKPTGKRPLDRRKGK